MPDPAVSAPIGTAQTDITALTFEDALRELTSLIERLESGQAPLEEAITAYERGIALKRHCEAKLADAQARIEKIRVTADGAVSAEPFAEAAGDGS